MAGRSGIGGYFGSACRVTAHDAAMIKAHREKSALIKDQKPYGLVEAHVDRFLDGSSKVEPAAEVVICMQGGFEEEGLDGFAFGNAQKLWI